MIRIMITGNKRRYWKERRIPEAAGAASTRGKKIAVQLESFKICEGQLVNC